ncbi:MAG: type II toxin-antitoxin system RelE/ParE family toxin [Tepidisphaeraceae bacterium]
MRAAIFHPAALNAIREFPPGVRRALGQAIWELQQEAKLGMPLSKPMPAVAAGVEELRVKDRSGAYRAFYYVRSKRGVLIFHAFEKRTRKTPKSEITLGARRLREMLDEEG